MTITFVAKNHSGVFEIGGDMPVNQFSFDAMHVMEGGRHLG